MVHARVYRATIDLLVDEGETDSLSVVLLVPSLTNHLEIVRDDIVTALVRHVLRS